MTFLGDVTRAQSTLCAELGSPMYADLLDRVAGDLEAGGISSEVLAEHSDAPASDAVPLRLMGSVHRLVLERRAGALATFYPSVGGRWTSDPGWDAFQNVLIEQSSTVAAGLSHPPQTNEVGRSAALIGGLHNLSEDLRMPVRLFEIGASAGLNLLSDRFGFVDAQQARFGSADDTLVFPAAWNGRSMAPWPDLEIVERAGCDVLPVDPRSTEGRLTLTSYVWADQAHRLEHLRAALAVAARMQVDVRRQSAAEFVAGLTLKSGTTTVVWHSVMWQYLSPGEQQSIEESLDRLAQHATPQSPLVRLSFEPTGWLPEERGIVLETWSGQAGHTAAGLIGTAPAHGLPCTWV